MPKKATREHASNAYTCTSRPSARAKQFVAELQQKAPNKDILMAEFRVWCVRREYGDADAAYVLEALLQLGLKPEDIFGEDSSQGETVPTTVLQSCLFSPTLLQQIITSGNLTPADLNRKQPGGLTLLHIVCLYTSMAAKNATGARKRVAVENLLSSCKLLLEHGADPEISHSSGLTVLDAARRAAALDDDRVVELVMMIGSTLLAAGRMPRFHLPDTLLCHLATRRALKLAPGALISKLRRLAADATPLSIHTAAANAYNATVAAAASVTAVPDGPAEGVAAASSGFGPSNAAWGFKRLPDHAFEQASLLLWAAECKLATLNQVVQLVPLACIPDLAADIGAAASNIAIQVSENGGNEAVDQDLVTDWLSALNTNPWQLGLYAMANSIKQLQDVICLNPRTLSTAAQGIKALTAYAHHLTAQSTTSNVTSSSSNTDQVFLVPSKQVVPGFVQIADSVANLVSWTIVSNGNVRAEDNPLSLEPLVETGYHKDLLTLLGMGYLQAGRGLAGITWIPTAAVDVLELLAANNGDNIFTRQMTTAMLKIIKAANKGRTVECKHLQEALWCAKSVMKCSFMLFPSVHYTYYYSDRAAISPLLDKAMPLIAKLHGTPLAAALSAAADLTLNQLHCSSGANRDQVKVMTDDWRQFNRVSRQAIQGLEFAKGVTASLVSNGSSDKCNGTATATCSVASTANCSSSSVSQGGAESSSSSSRQADWGGYEQDDSSLPSYLFLGIKRCHEFLVSEVCREMGVKQSGLDMFAEVSTTHGMVEACRTLQLWAAFDPLMGKLASRFHRPQLVHLAKQTGDITAALENDRSQRRAVRRDQNCWGCGITAEEAVAAGHLSLPSVGFSARLDRAKLLTCNRCKVAKYCCVKCQKTHWKNSHKQECIGVPTGECRSPEELVELERACVKQRVEELTRSLQMDFAAVAQSGYKLDIGPAKTD